MASIGVHAGWRNCPERLFRAVPHDLMPSQIEHLRGNCPGPLRDGANDTTVGNGPKTGCEGSSRKAWRSRLQRLDLIDR